MPKDISKLLKNRNFCNLWLGQILSQISINMLSFILAVSVYLKTGSNFSVSLLLLAFGIPSVFFGVLAGSLVDFFDKRKVMALSNLSRAFLILILAFVSGNISFLFIIAVVVSIITQFFIPAEGPAIPDLVPKSDLLAANSLFSISFYLSTVAGFIIGGPFLKFLGQDKVYFFVAFLMLCAYFYVLRIPSIKRGKPIERRSNIIKLYITSFREGAIFIGRNSRIRASLLLMTFAQALIMTFSVLAPGFADKTLNIQLEDSSIYVLAPAALGIILGALFVGARGKKFLKGDLILSGIILSGLSLILLSVFTGNIIKGDDFVIFKLPLGLFFLFTSGFFSSFITVPANTVLLAESRPDLRGQIYGLLTALTGGASLIPALFSGLAADSLGVNTSISLFGILILLLGIIEYVKRRKVYNSNICSR